MASLLWLYATSSHRTGEKRRRVPDSALFPPWVREELLAAGEVGASFKDADSSAFAKAMNADAGKAFGVVLVKPLWVADVTRVLSAEQRTLRDYYLHTKWRGVPLQMLEVLEACALDTPERVYESVLRSDPRGVVFQMTNFSAKRVLACFDDSGCEATVQENLEYWSGDHGFDYTGQTCARTCLMLPAAHCRLLTAGRWKSTGFPRVVGKARSVMGLHFVPQLLGPMPEEAEDGGNEADDEDEEISADRLQCLADMLRDSLRHHDTPDVRRQIRWLQQRRDAMEMSGQGSKKAHFALEDLISCVLASSLLKSASGLLEQVEWAIKIAVRDRSLQSHLLSRLRDPNFHAVASAPTVVRQRLMLTLGFYLWQAELAEELHSRPGGAVSWRTVDGSPKGGWDWVLHGKRSMASEDLLPAFDAARALCDSATEVGVSRAHARFLEPLLRLVQGAPVGVGSGKASVRRKVHAVVHSERLQSVSWPAAVKMVNHNMTWTGDCGTESGFWLFRSRLADLFGDWLCTQTGQQDDFAFHDPTAGPPDLGDALRGEGGTDFAFFENEAANEQEFAFHDPPAGPADLGDALQVGENADFVFHDPTAAGEEAAVVSERARDERPVFDVWPEHEDPTVIDFTPSVFIAGMLHIINLVTEKLENRLAWFDTWLLWLTQVCRLLSRRYSRERMQEQCFADGAAAPFRHRFDSFSCGVYKGRWGSIFHALSCLLPLEAALRAGWSLGKYKGDGGTEEHKKDDKSLKVDVADEGIRSHRFWAYSHMIDIVGSVLEQLARWAEGCPCHPVEAGVETAARHLRRRTLRERLGMDKCPLCSCKAFACAAGEALQFLDQLFVLANSTLLLLACMAPLDEESRSCVMNDFAQAREHVLFYMRVKLGHWGQLPWLLFALAHPVEDVARSCMRRALALYEVSEKTHLHWWVLVLLVPGSIGYAQMVQFVQGAPLNELLFLKQMAARFFFAMVSERWIEGRHARTTKTFQLAPHSGPRMLAFTLIHEQLKERLRAEPELLTQFAACCSRVRNSQQGVHAMGLSKHPAVQKILQSRIGRRGEQFESKHRDALTKVLFHLDPFTLYSPLPEVSEQSPSEQSPSGNALGTSESGAPAPAPSALASSHSPEARGEQSQASGAPQTYTDVVGRALGFGEESACVFGGGVHDELWRNAAVEHILRLCDDNTSANLLPPIFSVGPHMTTEREPWWTHMLSLTDLTNPDASALVPAGSALGGATPTCRGDSPLHVARGDPWAGTANMRIFQIVSAGAGRMVVPQGAPRVGRGQICARMLQVESLDKANKQVHTFLEGSSGEAVRDFGVFSPALLTITDLMTWRTWDRASALQYSFDVPRPEAVQPGYNRVVGRLCTRESDETGRFAVVVINDSDDKKYECRLAMQWLESHGLVEALGTDISSSSWRLCAGADKRLRILTTLTNPRLTLGMQLKRADVDIMTASAFTLHCLLHVEGWAWSVKAPGRQKFVEGTPEPSPYSDGQEKRWWLRHDQNSFSEDYFRALLLAPQHGKEVRPFQTNQHYQDIIAGREPRTAGTASFHFHMGSDAAAARPLKKLKTKRVHTPSSPRVELEDEASEAEPSDEQPEVPPCFATVASSDAASSASASGSATSSSSSTSSSSAPKDQEHVVDFALGGFSSQYWKTFKFTARKVDGVAVGWEACCYLKHPGNTGKKCQRAMLFSAGGGRARTERRLKHWCVSGLTTDAHGQEPRYVPLEELPTLEALQAVVVPQRHLEEMAEVLERRGVRAAIPDFG